MGHTQLKEKKKRGGRYFRNRKGRTSKKNLRERGNKGEVALGGENASHLGLRTESRSAN